MAKTSTGQLRTCCFIECGKPAEFEIVTSRTGNKLAGPDPYSDNTDACEAHVGALLGHQLDAEKPEEIFWSVFSLS